jgi:hypothetical protein
MGIIDIVMGDKGNTRASIPEIGFCSWRLIAGLSHPFGLDAESPEKLNILSEKTISYHKHY